MSIELRTILRLFPYLDKVEDAKKLKIDHESLYYISIREQAEEITNIIKNYINKIEIDKKNIIITDATAGVGGNTISFAKSFKKVNAIEINKKRCEYLENNMKIYNLKNINIINDNCIKYINKIEQDIVYIDPPWGGRIYKNYEKLTLKLSNMEIEDICNNLFDEKYTKHIPKMIILKLPLNYNKIYIKQKVKGYIYIHELKKMMIMIIINKNYNFS